MSDFDFSTLRTFEDIEQRKIILRHQIECQQQRLNRDFLRIKKSWMPLSVAGGLMNRMMRFPHLSAGKGSGVVWFSLGYQLLHKWFLRRKNKK